MSDDLDTLCADYLERLRYRAWRCPQQRPGTNHRPGRRAPKRGASSSSRPRRNGCPPNPRTTGHARGDCRSRYRGSKDGETAEPCPATRVGHCWSPIAVALALGLAALEGAFSGGRSNPPSASHPIRIAVPNVLGLEAGKATASLQASGLKNRTVFQSSGNVPNGVVFEQSPHAGATVPRSEVITLAVSIGPTAGAVVVVPDVVGMSPSDAAGALQAVGLYNSIDNLNCSARIGSGHTVSEAPNPGSQVARGTRISIQVACHP